MMPTTKIAIRKFWFELGLVSYGDPSKLPANTLSICMVPIQLPEGCVVKGGIPAALAIARARGDDANIEWMAIHPEFKQELCAAFVQLPNYVSGEWFQLINHGTTEKSKQRTINDLRRTVFGTPR